ncbi:MAG: FGLLP motif-containing membrane protein [Acidimicrobiales bacterium]
MAHGVVSRRVRSVAVVGTLVVLILTMGGWQGASGDQPEGSGGTTVNVTPSDDLPDLADVTVEGVGFFPDISTGLSTVFVAQCVEAFGSCGTAREFSAPNGSFSGTITVSRMLTLSDTTVDCTQVACSVRADGGAFVAHHHLTFSGQQATTTTTRRTIPPVVVTTTTRPAVTTTRPAAPTPTTRPAAPTTTRPAGPGTTLGGATVPPTTSVARATPSTVAQSTTSSTALAATTTSTPPPPVGDRPPLVAVTPRNQPSGPPGGGLHVEGGGYTCDTVYFFFDGVRVGSDSPDGGGHVSKNGLSVPGDAGKGRHRVTSSCDASGATIEQASFFEVVPVAVHRPAFVTSLPLPDQVSLDPRQLLLSAAVAVGAILLIAFPYELFNSTVEENYDEIRSWFGLGPRGVDEAKVRSRTVTFFVMCAVTAVTFGFLSPDFGLNMTSLVLSLGAFVALIVMAVVFSLPADIGIHRRFGEWGKLNFLPGSVVIAVVMVVLSRLVEFQPGYMYGALAGLAFRSALSEKEQGKLTAANWLLSLVVSVGAFFLRAPVTAAAAEPGSSIWWIGLEICLAIIFLWGVEGLAVAMLPMRFLDGQKVMRWNRAAWAVLFFLGVFATVHVLLRPGSGYVGETSDTVTIGVMVLYVLFGLGSAAFWAYFRYRPAQWAAARS